MLLCINDYVDIAAEKVTSLECGKATERQISSITGVVFSKCEWSCKPSIDRNLDPHFIQGFKIFATPGERETNRTVVSILIVLYAML